MRITTKGRYALRAMVFLARNGKGSPISIKTISEQEDISPEFLEQIFFRLKKTGIVRSVRGPGGGFSLNNEPSAITLKHIFEAAGEVSGLTPCTDCSESPDCCQRVPTCSVADTWKALSDKLNAILTNVTLENVMNNQTAQIISKL